MFSGAERRKKSLSIRWGRSKTLREMRFGNHLFGGWQKYEETRGCRSVAKEKHTILEDEGQKRHLQIELERQSKRKQEKKIRI